MVVILIFYASLLFGDRENEITFKQLASLSDKDLEMLGITDQRTRQQKLEEFSVLPNQEPFFDK